MITRFLSALFLFCACSLVSVHAANPPSLTFSPSSTTVTVGSTIQLSMTASCPIGLERVGFEWQSTQCLYVRFTSATSDSQTISWTAPAVGTYVLGAFATSSAFVGDNVETSSSYQTITVVPAANGISWGYTGLPSTGYTGSTIYFTAYVTNSGTKAWGSNHYLELCDSAGTHLYYPSVSGIAPGGSTYVSFALTLPSTPGTYSYGFTGMEYGVEYFGGTQWQSITVNDPLSVTLSLDSTSFPLGLSTTARSTANPSGQLSYHGLEGRLAGGTWQNWGIWNDSGGTQQTVEVGPSSAGTYELRSYAARADLNGIYSSSVMLVVSSPLPAVPAVQSASSVTSSSFTANWSASTGATSYRLDVSTSSSFSSFISGYSDFNTGSATSQSVTGLTPGQSYYYRVRAVNAYGTSANSSTVAATAPADTTAPSVPANLSCGSSGNTSLALSWTSSSDNVATTAYDVSVMQATGNLARTLSVGTNSCTFSGLSAGFSYTIKVRARDAAGNASAWSSEITATTTGTQGVVTLSRISFSTANKPVISTTEPMPSKYKLRCKIGDGVTSGGFHAATTMNNNGLTLDVLPSVYGTFPAELYWIKYDDSGSYIYEYSGATTVTVTITSAAYADNDGDGISNSEESLLGTNPDLASQNGTASGTTTNIHRPIP